MLCILAASGEHVDLEELVDDFVTFYIAGEPAILECMFMIHVHVACNMVLLVRVMNKIEANRSSAI